MNIQGFSPLMSAPMQAQSAGTNATSGSSSSSGSTSGSNGLSSGNLESTFLNLLVTELQNQDPTQPVATTEMVSQMVSLNSLDQLISINQTLSSLTGSPTASASASSAQAAGTAAPANATASGNGTTAAALANSATMPAGTAFQSTGVPYSGPLTNLYGNIGASTPTSNHFTAVGGK
jgi:flagellar basal-body rod modification protein FlgD